MKKLILIRHAEAEPETSITTDFDRPLTDSGKKEAAKTAAFLLNKCSAPETIVSSPALRALATAEIFAATFGMDEVKSNQKIYEADVNSLLQIITQTDNQYAVAALVGHNPGISNLLYSLTDKITTIPTAAWAEVELEAESWDEVSTAIGKLLQYQYP